MDDLVFRVEDLLLLVDDGLIVSSVLEVDDAKLKLVASVLEAVTGVEEALIDESSVLEDGPKVGEVDNAMLLSLTDVTDKVLEEPTGTLLDSKTLVALVGPTGGG